MQRRAAAHPGQPWLLQGKEGDDPKEKSCLALPVIIKACLVLLL